MTPENILSRYGILHELGRGAVGATYAARDRTSGALVALKRLDPTLSKSDASFTDRLLKQARSAQRLRHRNIVQIHDVGEAAGTIYIAMEMLEGESLRSILDRGPLPVARAIQIAHEIGCGLAHAHLEGVVHEGLKPSNIIVLRSGVAKITDFGIGQLAQAAQPSGTRAGGLGYMAPEQLRGEPVDHRCDIFSLGAVFYEMLTRRRPFEGDSPNAILKGIPHAAPRPPSELNPSVPRALDAIVLSMLAVQPAARMAGVPVLLRELERLEEGLGLGSGANAGADEPKASAPPAEPRPRTSEPGLRTPEPTLRTREPGLRTPEPALRTPEPNSFRYRAPVQPRINDRDEFDYHRAMMERESEPERSSRSRPAIFAALALLLAFLGGGLTAYMNDWSGRSEQGIVASRMQAPAIAPEASRPTAPPSAPVAEAPREAVTAPSAPQASPPPAMGDVKTEQQPPATLAAADPTPPKTLAAEPDPVAQTESMVARRPEQPAESPLARPTEQPASAGAPPAQQPLAAMQPEAKVASRQSGGTARLILAVSPQGELYINGKHQGTTPPITTLDLEPGMHRVEVRNGSRRPYLTYMTIEAGDVRRIRHDFNAKPIRPPR
jgi:serine/threonine-protein kinase